MKTLEFNPNNIGIPNGNYFGLPYSAEEAEIVLLPVPWDVTTSYRSGSHKGPKAMIDASLQIDLYDPLVSRAWEIKIGTLPTPKGIENNNRKVRKTAEVVISALEAGLDGESKDISLVNSACEALHQSVFQTSRIQLEKGKTVGVVGGEHSVPLGLIRALADRYKSFGILHIDAHADLRCAYEGFTYSHASIMHNAIQLPQVTSLVQVGIRDYCQNEAQLIQSRSDLFCFGDIMLHNRLFEGATWHQLCTEIIQKLPSHVYISFDIDGLMPDLCPNTGTPVPGGLSFREADYLLHLLATSGKSIIGFDLCEVAPGRGSEWDANVGARLLYKLCCYTYSNMGINR
ncbi:MAG: agmatinase family protein [Prevotellaceae bacterium]|jgi:agmatinase|nr:agmatinase family protein [Prevotellaceae bacterium]